MAIVGVGIDVVSIPEFAEQVDQPGTVFAETFTPASGATPRTRVRSPHGIWLPVGGQGGRHQGVVGFTLCAASRAARRIHRDIEVVTDMGPAQGAADWRDCSASGRGDHPCVADA